MDITLALVKPLLYHFYASNAYRVPDTIMGYMWIISFYRRCLMNLLLSARDVMQNNLLNLGLLPKMRILVKGIKS